MLFFGKLSIQLIYSICENRLYKEVQLTKYMSEKGYEPTGVVYEYYYNSPDEIPESELLTKVEFLLK